MSRGSTFTLYRAYNNFKISDICRSNIIAAYHDYNKEHDWGYGLGEDLPNSEREKIVSEREKRWTEDIPIVLNMDFSKDYDFDKEEKFTDVDEYRKNNYSNFALRDDGRMCDKLLEWNFNSSFDCLIEHYNLNYYNFRDNAVIIPKEDAKEMLSAIEYLLGEKWDDSIEKSMNNPWIKIFSEGGNCDSYWKYVYRHRYDSRKNTYKFSENGVKVTVSFPNSKKHKECEEEDYRAELSESNETAEFYMRNTANALRAFLESDNWSYGNETELVLVYSSWG